VAARINDAGDGILIEDQAGGTETLKVEEVGSGTTASDLGLLRVAVEGRIDGTTTNTITIDADDTIDDLVTKINALGVGVSASLLHDGIGKRLSITTDNTGEASELLVDTSGSAIVLDEISSARDALLAVGHSETASRGVLLASSDNEFVDVVDGIDLTIHNGTLETVTVDVTSTSTQLKSALQDFVAAYNSIRDKIDELTAFDEANLTTGILFGTTAVLRVESDLAKVVGRTFFGVGRFETLEAIGIQLDILPEIGSKGRLTFDAAKFDEAYALDAEAVEQLLTDKTFGAAARLNEVIDQLAGSQTSVLVSRSDSLKNTTDLNTSRIEDWDERLTRQRERLLLEFFRLEETVARLQQNLSALNAFTAIPPLTSSSNRNTR
jgi:flagellar hook-associated protein 2